MCGKRDTKYRRDGDGREEGGGGRKSGEFTSPSSCLVERKEKRREWKNKRYNFTTMTCFKLAQIRMKLKINTCLKRLSLPPLICPKWVGGWMDFGGPRGFCLTLPPLLLPTKGRVFILPSHFPSTTFHPFSIILDKHRVKVLTQETPHSRKESPISTSIVSCSCIQVLHYWFSNDETGQLQSAI